MEIREDLGPVRHPEGLGLGLAHRRPLLALLAQGLGQAAGGFCLLDAFEQFGSDLSSRTDDQRF